MFCGISGYGATGPYKNLPSHGIAYDTWAGLVNPAFDEDGHPYIPEHPSMGIHAGPLFGALGVLAGIIRARETGEGCRMEIAQSDAAAAMDWLRSETFKAYERPESEVTGNKSDNYERRAPGTAGMKGGVRYQIYESADGYVIFMASEREFWKNFCEGIGRPELFEAHPGSQYADHARGDLELRDELTAIFKTRTTGEWVIFGEEHNTTIAPVNTPKTIADDPQFKDRMPWLPASEHGIDMLPDPHQAARRGAAAALDVADGRRALRRGAARRAGLGRRPHRRAASLRRPRLIRRSRHREAAHPGARALTLGR